MPCGQLRFRLKLVSWMSLTFLQAFIRDSDVLFLADVTRCEVFGTGELPELVHLLRGLPSQLTRLQMVQNFLVARIFHYKHQNTSTSHLKICHSVS